MSTLAVDSDAQVADLVATARGHSARATARLISAVEDGAAELRRAVAAACAGTARAMIVGLTGSPGVGKSTVADALIGAYRERRQRVGVLAVDPSSPFSGGAVLGDRIRMQRHALDPDVYIRSMANRGVLGGLAAAVPEALRVLEACGFDQILLETVGVGQVEVDVAAHADTTVVLVAPGMGDSIQVAKAGILEVADVLVVNKADRPGAESLAAELQQMLALADRGPADWRPAVVQLRSLAAPDLAGLVAALDARAAWLAGGGAREARRTAQAAAEIEALAVQRLRESVLAGAADVLDELAAAVAAGSNDPYTAAERLLAATPTTGA